MFIIFFFSFLICADNTRGQQIEAPKNNYILTYYFHGNFRCVNCHNIEQYTKEAVEKYFQKELDTGKVVFKVIDVEIKGNEHFTNDYQLYTKSVILSLVKNGKEVKFDNPHSRLSVLGLLSLFPLPSVCLVVFPIVTSCSFRVIALQNWMWTVFPCLQPLRQLILPGLDRIYLS